MLTTDVGPDRLPGVALDGLPSRRLRQRRVIKAVVHAGVQAGRVQAETVVVASVWVPGADSA